MAVTARGYLRYPHLHGDLVTCVAEDDVWVVPLSGGRAWRLSADGVPVSHPRFSPDGRWIAWTSHRDGDPEVHVAPAEGGPARRITYWGDGATRVCGWTPDGQVLALTSWRRAFAHHMHAYAVPVEGGPARPMGWGPVGDACLAADGQVLVATVPGQEPALWKRYRGGAQGRLWCDRGDGFARLLPGLDGNLACPMWVGGRVAFLSDHEGTARLYSCLPDGSDLRRHDGDPPGDDAASFYARHAATDGARVVYQRAGELRLVDRLGAAPVRLAVRLGGPRTGRRPRPVSPCVSDLSCDRTGRGSAVEVRGGVYWLTHRDGPVRALAADPAVRARLPRVLGEDQVVWVTTAEGDDALQIGPACGHEGPGFPAPPRRLAAGRLGHVDDLAAAPDGRTVAVAAHDGRLLLVDVATGAVETLAASDNGPVTDLCFSPDSAWLAWSHPGIGPLSRIRLARVADRTVTDVTDGRFADAEPVFTLDGAYLVFLSWRGFDPVFDSHIFDLAFPFGCRPYLVPLAASARSPFSPTSQGRPAGTGDDDRHADATGDGGGEGGGEGGRKDGGVRPITVDLEDIGARVVPFPVPEARYSSLHAVKNGLVWLRMPLAGMLGEGGAEPGAGIPRPALERYDLRKCRCEEIVGELDWLRVSRDGERLVIGHDGGVRVVAADGSGAPDGDESSSVDLSRLRVTADPAAEWRQAFEEAGRVVRAYFWAGTMAGVDWPGALARYRPLVERIATPDDFADLLGDLLGELGTSHAYVHAARTHHGVRWLGMLGADIERDAGQVWRIRRILPAETSDPYARSPLAEPGIGVRPGDALLAVDGRPVDPVDGPGPLLAGSADTPVELTIAPAAGGAPRPVVVRPLLDDRRLRYQAWVAERRRWVRERSGGRLGYLHIPDMTGVGWAQFHRDLRLEIANPGLVLDIRGNRGGIVSELVVEKLSRRVIGWDVGRHRGPVSYPDDAPRGPVVVLADEHTCSDGDLLTAAIRTLGLGTVVGTRTWGGVVGIHTHRLVDGTVITVPRHATWFEGHGWGLENHGVDPDIEVVVAPGERAEDHDPQLETAVRVALERLASHPPAAPPPRP